MVGITIWGCKSSKKTVALNTIGLSNILIKINQSINPITISYQKLKDIIFKTTVVVFHQSNRLAN